MIEEYVPFDENAEPAEEECGDICGLALAERVCEVCEDVYVACYEHERWVLTCEECREV